MAGFDVTAEELWVAVAVVAFFGISGAWGFKKLGDANTQLEKLKNGLPEIQVARDNAIRALDQKKTTNIADFTQQANGIAHQAVNGEVQEQIRAVKKWTALIYEQAAGFPPGTFASGYWQKVLKDKNSEVQQSLR